MMEKRSKEVQEFYGMFGKYMGKDEGSDLFVGMNVVGEFLVRLF